MGYYRLATVDGIEISRVKLNGRHWPTGSVLHTDDGAAFRVVGQLYPDRDGEERIDTLIVRALPRPRLVPDEPPA
jgi:hypothetical protein